MSSPAASCHISSLLFLFSLSLLSTVEARRGLLHRESDHHRVNGCLLTKPRRTKADKEKGPGARENNDDIYHRVVHIGKCLHFSVTPSSTLRVCVGSLSLSQNAFWLQNEPPSKGKETRFRRRRRRPGKRLSSVSFVSFDDRETLCERTHTRQNRYRA